VHEEKDLEVIESVCSSKEGLSWLVVIFTILNPVDQLCGSSLNTLNQFNVMLSVYSDIPHLDAVFQVWSDETFIGLKSKNSRRRSYA